MANPKKNHGLYAEFVDELGKIASQGSPSFGFERLLDRIYVSFLGGFRPNKEKEIPKEDFSAEIARDLTNYMELSQGRKIVEVGGSKREITTETEAYETLLCANNLISNLVVPFVETPTNFTNRLFHEISNMSFSCLESIVNGVAQEYVERTDAAEAKLRAADVARLGQRIGENYFRNGIKYDQLPILKRLGERILRFPKKFLRAYETAAASPKEIVRKTACIDKVKEQVLRMEGENLAYAPHLVCPIAQGGNELGIVLANAYEDIGHFVYVYPLMYSIKTRKQRYPWIEHDGEFLSEHVSNRDVLLTEDWVTTGNTVRGILKELEDAFPKEVRIATIKRDPEQSKAAILNKYDFFVGLWTPYTGPKTDSISDLKKF
jgi:hypoxanthine-guanine phosphoribosyltransferase